MLINLLTNWKTTLAGAAAILTSLADVATQVSGGNIGSGQIEKDFIAILVGLGLIAAKDATTKG